MALELPVIYRHEVPATQFQYVSVTFAGANADLDIRHTLSPPTPEDLDYVVVRKDRACDIYQDTSGTRKAWTSGVIFLRSSVASAVVTLLLTVRRT